LTHAPTTLLRALPGCLLGVLAPVALFAQTSDLGRIEQSLKNLKIPAEISADEMGYSREQDALTARGHIRLRQGPLSLEADEATLDRASGRMTVSGGISARDGDDTLTADAMELDLNARTAVLTHGRLFLPKDHYHVTGERIERLADQRYRIERATITTCDWDEIKRERPTWQVRARRMTIEPEQYLTARDVVFTVHDVPVLYLPYLVWPVKTERQTGLLQPHLAYSHSEGLKIRQPLFITLGPSQDMTLTLDERTKRGTGGVLEYRYRLSRRSSGEVTADVFHDRVPGEGRVKGTLRRRLSTAQAVDFNERLQLRVSGQYVSDDSLLRDLTSTTFERTRRTIESNLFLTYHDAYQAMTLLTRYTRDLLQPDDTAVQLLPSLDYRLTGARAWSAPLFVSVQASAVNFWRRTGFSTQRADLFPIVLWRQDAPHGFVVTPRLGVRETLYSNDALGGDPVRRELGVAGLGVANAARREWRRGGPEGGALVHAVEPAVLYTYVGERRAENLPRFDEVDEIAEQSLVTATLTNRLIARAGGDDLEVVWVRLTQSYRLARRPDAMSGVIPPAWSALRGEATLRTGTALTLDADVFYDHDGRGRRFTTVDTDVRVNGGRYWDLAFGHRSTREATDDRPLPQRGDFLDPLSLGGVITGSRAAIDYYIAEAHAYLPRGFTLANKTYYNQRTGKYTEIDYGLEYRAQCWSLTLTYTDFPEKSNELSFLLTLVGATSVDSKAASTLFMKPAP